MQPDDLEGRLRNELRSEVDALDFDVDAQALRRRLGERRGTSRWLGFSSRLVLAAAGAVAALAVVMVATIWLRGTALAPSTGSGTTVSAPPAHVLVVREVRNATETTMGSAPVLEGRLVDPTTLKPVAGLPAVRLGRFYQTAVSHDGQTLAVVRWPGENPYNGELILLNLANGKQTTTGVRIDGEVPVMAFASDDRSVTWIAGDRGPGTAAYRVVTYPLGGKVQFGAALPRNTWPMDGRRQENGDLVVFAAQAGVSDGSSLAPHVLFVSTDGKIRADLELSDLRAGDWRQEDGNVAIDNPGLAWDTKHRRLYVVHAEADLVTVVDLAGARVVAQVDAAAGATGFLGSLGVGSASAKLEAGNDRSAALSADGSRLYAVGGTRKVVGTGNDMQFGQTPLGGFVLDTRTLTRVATIDLKVDRVLTGSGGRLVFTGTTMTLATEAQSEASRRTELVVTDGSLRVSAQRSLAAYGWLVGLSADGATAYVASGTSVSALSLDRLSQWGSGSGFSVEPSVR
jgi:hypothetical protein